MISVIYARKLHIAWVWYEATTHFKIELSAVRVLYGIIGQDSLDKLTNYLLLIAKYYKYRCSIDEESLCLSSYLLILENKAEIEEQVFFGSSSSDFYFVKRKPLIEADFVAT